MSHYAGVVTRLAALVVDGVVLSIAVPAVANGPPSMWASIDGDAPGWLKAACQFAAALIPILYFSLCWWATGQTLGGLLFGTVVRRADGSPLTLWRALLRAFVGLLVPLLWLAGLFFALWDPKRRALHDRLFGTAVWYKQRKVLAI
ncbi:hypothetical protein Rhe02_48970 [Rhizocola hellebori]|uniref:RDD domain-containing protein n=1 Tax=Rhizocola hellebori TaxID=1392758 RepID=A0A8J3QC26_9ACTN|nr:RDD family protein [Rhizocola hellebori]GIH06830.1 hypothetical protein Rhe02_48970 [Rhizocola hellebori]